MHKILALWVLCLAGCFYNPPPYKVYIDSPDHMDHALAAAEIWNNAGRGEIVSIRTSNFARGRRACDTATIEFVSATYVRGDKAHALGHTELGNDGCRRDLITVSDRMNDEYTVYVLAHEIGHAMGLGHTFDFPNSLMARYMPKSPVVDPGLLETLGTMGRLP